MSGPTGPDRDSSLRIDKAPGNMDSDAPRSPAADNVVRRGVQRQRAIAH